MGGDDESVRRSDTNDLESEMCNQYADPVQFYTKSKSVLKKVVPEGQSLVKKNTDGSLPDPSAYGNALDSECRGDTEMSRSYGDPMDFDCDSDSGDFQSVQMSRETTADSNFPDAAPAPDAPVFEAPTLEVVAEEPSECLKESSSRKPTKPTSNLESTLGSKRKSKRSGAGKPKALRKSKTNATSGTKNTGSATKPSRKGKKGKQTGSKGRKKK